MIGLGYILFFAIYFFFTSFVARFARGFIKAKIPARIVGISIWLLSTGLIFWDAVTVPVVHSGLCAKDAGFVVYKTLEQWNQESPGAIDALEPTDVNDSQFGDTRRYAINQRFARDITRSVAGHLISQRREEIIDIQTGEILASYIDYYTNLGNPFSGSRLTGWKDYKVWIGIQSCEQGNRVEQMQFNDYNQLLESIGKR